MQMTEHGRKITTLYLGQTKKYNLRSVAEVTMSDSYRGKNWSQSKKKKKAL